MPGDDAAAVPDDDAGCEERLTNRRRPATTVATVASVGGAAGRQRNGDRERARRSPGTARTARSEGQDEAATTRLSRRRHAGSELRVLPSCSGPQRVTATIASPNQATTARGGSVRRDRERRREAACRAAIPLAPQSSPSSGSKQAHRVASRRGFRCSLARESTTSGAHAAPRPQQIRPPFPLMTVLPCGGPTRGRGQSGGHRRATTARRDITWEGPRAHHQTSGLSSSPAASPSLDHRDRRRPGRRRGAARSRSSSSGCATPSRRASRHVARPQACGGLAGAADCSP